MHWLLFLINLTQLCLVFEEQIYNLPVYVFFYFMNSTVTFSVEKMINDN